MANVHEPWHSDDRKFNGKVQNAIQVGDWEIVLYHDVGSGRKRKNLSYQIATLDGVSDRVKRITEDMGVSAAYINRRYKSKSGSHRDSHREVTVTLPGTVKNNVDGFVQLDVVSDNPSDGQAVGVELNVKALRTVVEKWGGEFYLGRESG